MKKSPLIKKPQVQTESQNPMAVQKKGAEAAQMGQDPENPVDHSSQPQNKSIPLPESTQFRMEQVFEPPSPTALPSVPTLRTARIANDLNMPHQMVWNKIRGTRTVYWEGMLPPDMSTVPPGFEVVPNPHAPMDDRAGIAKRQGGGGFFKKGGANRMVALDDVPSTQKGEDFALNEADDVSEYFGGRVKVYHQGPEISQQSPGAMLPAAPMSAPPALFPQQSVAWPQVPFSQDTARRPESSIMGGSASDFMVNSGLPSSSYAPWAHTRPDHTGPPEREDPSLRHPSTEAANQRHSALEQAIKMFVHKYGVLPNGRQLSDPVPGTSLFGGMTFSVLLPTGDFDLEDLLTDYEPYFSEIGGRSGDGNAIFDFLEIEYFKRLGRQFAPDDMRDDDT